MPYKETGICCSCLIVSFYMRVVNSFGGGHTHTHTHSTGTMLTQFIPQAITGCL